MAPTQHFRQKSRATPEAESQRKANKRKKSLKEKIRGVQRLLRQKNLPATVRVAQERMLTMLQENFKESAKKQQEMKMAKKYKMVKFFEKRKLSRMYKSCLNELTVCTDEQREELNSNLQLLKHQWNYITHFPKDEKYISLFPPTPCNNAETRQHKDDIFKMIKEKVDNGELTDTSDMILQSPKEKKSKQSKLSVIKQAIKSSSQQDNTEQGEDAFKTSLVDDFFIDTNPSEEVNEECSNICGTAAVTNKSKYSAMGLSDDKSASHHKVKRLKSEKDIAANKKKKKIKKKGTDESE
ncbi:rRNA-processing protein EFG1-like [Actinia tenebrosa]|uniref:rRNA-processing protein EFG1 n=1 Tax=Actinia tenebrosa TaxID=6105 RepID=A0A6P8JB10_ACTTE|nr:rRNA-processing protein EFG1-like [Actinia tenebrosa]